MCQAWRKWNVVGCEEIRAAASAGAAAAGSAATVRRLQLLRCQDDDDTGDSDTDLRLSVWRPRLRYRRQCGPHPTATAAIAVSGRRRRRDGDMWGMRSGTVGVVRRLQVRRRCLGVALLTTSCSQRNRKSRDVRVDDGDGASSASCVVATVWCDWCRDSAGRRASRDYDVITRRWQLYVDFYKTRWRHRHWPSSY